MDGSDVFVLLVLIAVIGILAWAEIATRRRARDADDTGPGPEGESRKKHDPRHDD